MRNGSVAFQVLVKFQDLRSVSAALGGVRVSRGSAVISADPGSIVGRGSLPSVPPAVPAPFPAGRSILA